MTAEMTMWLNLSESHHGVLDLGRFCNFPEVPYCHIEVTVKFEVGYRGIEGLETAL